MSLRLWFITVSKKAQPFRASFVTLLAILLVTSSLMAVEPRSQPRTFVLDLNQLTATKQDWKAGNTFLRAEVARLTQWADWAAVQGPFSVTFTSDIAPSGDPHDLVSYGYYWWPDPDEPDGVPWIHRDGMGNPNADLDWNQVYGLAETVRLLGLGYFFTENERYAEKAASLLRTFFLDEATRMNPRILYSGIIPGVHQGSFGVPGLGNALGGELLFDGAGLLESSPHWTEADQRGLKKWAHDLAAWAATSSHGAAERDSLSNHSTNYDFVVALLGLYAGDEVIAQSNYRHFVEERLSVQLAENGSNSLEMKRANNLLYHRYNLSRSLDIAALGDKIEDVVDLFTYETQDGKSLKRATDFLSPYISGGVTWDRWPGEAFPRESNAVYYELLRRAAAQFHDPDLLDLAYGLGDVGGSSFVDLLYPESMVFENYLAGDADLNEVVNSRDLTTVFQAGRYDTNLRATWREGDWNGDRRFNSRDLIALVQHGQYDNVPPAATIPEPEFAPQVLSLGYLFVRRRRIGNDRCCPSS